VSELLADPFIRWNWIWSHGDVIWMRFVQHVELTGIAVLLGFLVAFPLGILAFRHPGAYPPIAWVAGLVYAIPSIALFVLLIPLTGLSYTTIEVGLVSYTQLILIRNIVVGLQSVPEDVKEVARGMGYTSRQLLWRVELPLALPAIVAGVRIATVSTIGLVTIGALIGRGGLGQFILEGLSVFFYTQILLGAVLSVALALTADGLLLATQRLLTPWTRRAKGPSVRPFVPWKKAGLPIG
jgi:osmoprotectant transport system permease protein